MNYKKKIEKELIGRRKDIQAVSKGKKLRKDKHKLEPLHFFDFMVVC